MDLPVDVQADLELKFVFYQLDQMLARGLERLPTAPAEPVRELHLELTHRCDLKCVMCEHWQQEHLDPASPGRELDFASLKAGIEAAATLREITTIVITGGEPWLRHDVVDVISWLSEKFPAAQIIGLTNFWNTGHLRKRLGDLRRRGVKNLKLGSSLDGLGSTHDAVRGQQGAFAGLERTVRALREEFPEYTFGFTFTILPRNASEIYAAHRFVAGELGAKLGFQWAVQTPGTEPHGWTPQAKAEALRQLQRIVTDLCLEHRASEKLKAANRDDYQWLWSELLYWRYLMEYGRDPRRFSFFLRCTAGERHVMVGAEGEVFFCPVERARTIGSLREAPLDALWSSPRAGEVRDFIATGQCHCWLRCVGTPAIDRLLRLDARPR